MTLPTRYIRTLTPLYSRKTIHIKDGHGAFIDFGSNDYLSLSGHPRLRQAGAQAYEQLPIASTGSRLLGGDYCWTHELEATIAKFKGKVSALLFNTGYQANCGVLSTLLGPKDVIFADKFIHASLIDGSTLSGARLIRFSHNHIEHLEVLLKKYREKYKKAIILTESLFSMEGDSPPLEGLIDLKKKYHCQLIVDEAHATGVYGAYGAGILEACGVQEDVDVIIGTFSKALAGFGAYVACSSDIKKQLIQSSRSFIYTTALPPALVAVNQASLAIVQEEPYRRKVLLENTAYVRKRLESMGVTLLGTTHVIPILLGGEKEAHAFSQKLKSKGYWCLPIRYPTVPKNQSRIRLSLCYDHSKEILDQFLDDIQ